MHKETELNIKRKRIKRKKKKIVYFLRFLVRCVVFSILIFLGYQIYIWGDIAYTNYKDSYAKYEQRKAEYKTIQDARFDNYTNILLLGIDEGKDEEAKRADAIILLSFDNNDGQLRIISIPRGTLINLPTADEAQKLSSVYSLGGEKQITRTVAQIMNVAIHHYISIDKRALVEIIDALGGIDIYVEHDMDYEDPEDGLVIKINKGFQHLDGDTTQKYLRYRADELGDLGRIHRQQSFLRAIYNELLSIDTALSVPKLVTIFQKRVVTSAEVFDSGQILKLIKDFSNKEPKTMILPGKPAVIDNTAWIVDSERLETLIKELFPELEPKKEEEGK